MPGLNAAFVDVGYEKDAVLHYLDLGTQFNSLNAYTKNVIANKGKQQQLSKFHLLPEIPKEGTIADILKPGQEILVQIAKEPISTKGPRLTSEISIAGRFLVLMPFSDKICRPRLNRLKSACVQTVVAEHYAPTVSSNAVARANAWRN